MQLNRATQIPAPCWPVDGLERWPHTLEPQVRREMRSKEGLARSNIDTPSPKVIEVMLPQEVSVPRGSK